MKINRNDYDNVRLDVEKLTPGGHKCVIKQVVEAKASTGKDMMVISFDTTEEDAQPKFYTNDYLAQEGMSKKWHGTHNIVQGNEYFMKNLKKFCGALEASNEGFVAIAEDGTVNLEGMKGKLVGIVFREEEYLANTGRKGTNAKPFYFCTYEDAPGREIPAKKELKEQPQAFASPNPDAAKEGFMAIPDSVEDEGLPFA